MKFLKFYQLAKLKKACYWSNLSLVWSKCTTSKKLAKLILYYIHRYVYCKVLTVKRLALFCKIIISN